MKKRIILAVTGASGSIYAAEFLKIMEKTDAEIHAMISDSGRKVLKIELGLNPEDLGQVHKWHAVEDFTAEVASGSARFDGMAVLPCTMGTLGAIAGGICSNLIHRAADVMLKEKRRLILAVRETPLNRTHLANMLKANDAGALICPPMPSFYHRPESLAEMAGFYAGRVAELLGFEIRELKRWKG